ncbi:hypothetical protein [Aliikangiella coralliicola]|uniref:Uncharacterized protein n=1 Tax=Aliikangiella coralliicola TaxID=2592383 RepID=A0A545U8L3_9GAMM|nr:hypothetical protein [Aliikangiella coralliicola]TQV85805.1 hypothetical protein FLL46_17930 [Aliikangiella coralliicola]
MKSGDKSLIFTVIVFGIFMCVFFIATETDAIRTVKDFFNQPDSSAKAHKQKITYYQWSEKGKMVIDTRPPEDGVDYISFEADRKLKSSTNHIDHALIAKAEKYREGVLQENKRGSRDDNQTPVEAASFVEELLSQQQGEAAQCVGLENWLTDISGSLKFDEERTKEFCELLEKRMSSLEQIGCKQTLKRFESSICG